jgi:hypothetical protein
MDHKAEAERLTGIIQQTIDETPPPEVAVSMADGCRLAQVHATLYLADRVDALVGLAQAAGEA